MPIGGLDPSAESDNTAVSVCIGLSQLLHVTLGAVNSPCRELILARTQTGLRTMLQATGGSDKGCQYEAVTRSVSTKAVTS
jgi:hypothetical protein